MTAQRLADRAGVGLTRTVIANIESGRKTDLPMSQFLAIAAALEIPPANLAFDLRNRAFLKLDLPTGAIGKARGVPTWKVARWWLGDGTLTESASDPASGIDPLAEYEPLLPLLASRETVLHDIEELRAKQAERVESEDLRQEIQNRRWTAEADLQSIDALLARFGLRPSGSLREVRARGRVH